MDTRSTASARSDSVRLTASEGGPMRTARTLVAAMTLMFATAGFPAAISPGQESASRRPDEGIKANGHWTIELRDPDGTVAAHHEFENALVNQGAQVLA